MRSRVTKFVSYCVAFVVMAAAAIHLYDTHDQDRLLELSEGDPRILAELLIERYGVAHGCSPVDGDRREAGLTNRPPRSGKHSSARRSLQRPSRASGATGSCCEAHLRRGCLSPLPCPTFCFPAGHLASHSP